MSLPAVSTSSRAVLCSFCISVLLLWGFYFLASAVSFFDDALTKDKERVQKKTVQDCQMQASPIFCEQDCANILSFFVVGTINLQKHARIDP